MSRDAGRSLHFRCYVVGIDSGKEMEGLSGDTPVELSGL